MNRCLYSLILWLPACGFGPTLVQADPPERFDRVRELLTQSRTMILAHGGIGHWEIDLERRVVTGDLRAIDGSALRLVFVDGELWLHHLDEGPPVQLPALYASRFSTVFDALRTGMNTLTFVQADPSEYAPDWAPKVSSPGTYYRVDTPWTWDDDYSAYVNVHDTALGGEVGTITIVHRQTGLPLKLLGYEIENTLLGLTGARRNVPLDPQNVDPHVPSDWGALFPGPHATHFDPWQNAPYHDQIRRVWLEPALPNPNGRPDDIRYQHLCTQAGVTEHTHQQEWKVPAADVPRIAAAQASCDAIRFSAGMRADVTAMPGQQVCIEGTWSVVNLGTQPATVLTSEPVNVCMGDPSDIVGTMEPHLMEQQMPQGADLANLGLRWQGTYRFTCDGPYTPSTPHQTGSATTDFTATVFTDRAKPGQPLLTWDCFPGWDPPAP